MPNEKLRGAAKALNNRLMNKEKLIELLAERDLKIEDFRVKYMEDLELWLRCAQFIEEWRYTMWWVNIKEYLNLKGKFLRKSVLLSRYSDRLSLATQK